MPADLRVLFCTLGYEPGPVGGAERQARLQAEELVRRGHLVDVLTPHARGTRSETINGVSVRRLPRIDRRPLGTVSYLPALGMWLAVNIRRYDVVHVHLGNLQADAAGLASRRSKVPLYVKIAAGGARGEVQRMRKVAWLTHYVGLRAARRIQATSDEIERDLLDLGIHPERIVRIPNGLPKGIFQPITAEERRRVREELGLPHDRILVVHAGRFARYKGVLDLIGAWRALSTELPLTLVMVGEPASDDPVQIPSLPGMILRPWASNIERYLQAGDIYVHPSHADGMPNIVLEAMACGMAVIATRVAAVPMMIEDGESGLLVNIGAVDELRRAIERLAADRGTRQDLGKAASKRALRDYRIDRVVDQIEAAYRGMLAEVAH